MGMISQDIYGTSESRINRFQAMAIGPGEGTVPLCFARFTPRPEIQQLVFIKSIFFLIYFAGVPPL